MKPKVKPTSLAGHFISALSIPVQGNNKLSTWSWAVVALPPPDIFLYCPPPSFSDRFELGSLSEPEAQFQVTWLTSELLGFFCFCQCLC